MQVSLIEKNQSSLSGSIASEKSGREYLMMFSH
jgi:hypothetical protein